MIPISRENIVKVYSLKSVSQPLSNSNCTILLWNFCIFGIEFVYCKQCILRTITTFLMGDCIGVGGWSAEQTLGFFKNQLPLSLQIQLMAKSKEPTPSTTEGHDTQNGCNLASSMTVWLDYLFNICPFTTKNYRKA